jgi:predicted PurR-regulated permease PerM
MDEDKTPEGDSLSQRNAQTDPRVKPEMASKRSEESVPPSKDVGWAGAPTSQVIRTVAVALLTAVVVLVALFLLWQVRTFLGWLVIALFLAAALNPAVNWLQRRHRLMKRPLAIALTYLGVFVALLLVVGIFLPVLTDQINSFIKFVTTTANAPEGPTKYLRGLAKDNGLGGFLHRFSDQLHQLRNQLGGVLKNLLSSSGQIAISVAGMIAALATVLTLTFFLLLGSERYVNAGVGLFPERQQPLVRRLLSQSAGAISGYITGNLSISVICGITTFIVLLILGMPYAAPLALLVAVLDFIPMVGATLGGTLLVVVGLFVDPWMAVVLLVFFVVYQQVEGSILQPLVYSKAVHLNGLVILIALLVGGQLLGIAGALLAIPVAEIIRILITEISAYRRTRREENGSAVAPSPPPTASE